MKINYILLLFCCVIGFGCKKTVDYSNPYYDRMKKLADEAEADPNDKTALHKLEEYVTDSDSWNRIYSYGFLGELALKNIGGCQAALIPYFDDALKDSDYNVRQMGVQAVRDIGSPAVEKCLPELVLMVQRGMKMILHGMP